MSDSPFAGAIQFGGFLILAGSRHHWCVQHHRVRRATEVDDRDERADLLWCDWHREHFSAPAREVVDEVTSSLGKGKIQHRPTHH